MHAYPLLISEYIATVFSPNIVAYATLHASGQVRINPMQSDPSSPLVSVVLAQRFTNALKKSVTFDDIYLVAEQYMNDGTPLPISVNIRFRHEINTTITSIQWL